MTKPLTQLIVVTAGLSGGKPHVAGHRLTVQNVVVWHERMGLSVDEIATGYGLRPAQVRAALAHYQQHQAEVDDAIRADEAFVDELRSYTPSRLRMKLDG